MRLASALSVAGALAVLAPAEAAAYCRTAGCGEVVGARCEPPTETDCGVPLYWPTRCVGFSVQRDASVDVDLETARAVAQQAFAAWSSVACPTGAPSIVASDQGSVSCDRQEYNAEGKNANIIIFRDEEWAYADMGALALTVVTYALETGEIRDADIELNGEAAVFTTSDTAVEVDLPSILTHEAGHFLGLAHTPIDGATMQLEYPPQSVVLRSLEPDDVSGICAVYPPEREAPCDAEPHNGLGDECATPLDEDGCGCAVPGPAGTPPAVAAVVIALLLAAGRRSRQARPLRARRPSGRRSRRGERARCRGTARPRATRGPRTA
jgi:MYXO-CTERM domain-containing protein